MADGKGVGVSEGDESAVAWDVGGDLGSTGGELVLSVGLLGSIMRKNIPWVMAKVTDSFRELSVVLASGRAVADSIDAPFWSFAADTWSSGNVSGGSSVGGTPDTCRLKVVLAGWTLALDCPLASLGKAASLGHLTKIS